MLNFIYLVVSMYMYFWLTHRAEMKELEKKEKELARRSTITAKNGHAYLGTTDEGDDVFDGDIIEYKEYECHKGICTAKCIIVKAKAANACYIEHGHLIASGE